MKRNLSLFQILAAILLIVTLYGYGICEETDGLYSVRGIVSDKIDALETRQRLLFEETRQITDSLLRLRELEKAQKEMSDELKRLTDLKEVKNVLGISKNENEAEEKEVLSVAGREYTLRRKGSFGVDYDLTYTYRSDDAINFEVVQSGGGNPPEVDASIEDTSNHKLVTTLSSEYGVFNNLTLNLNLPLVYKRNNTQGGDNADDSADITDIGDVSAAIQWQPFKTGSFFGSPVINLSYSFPTGTSPYETTEKKYMSSGSGYEALSAEIVFSKAYDPLIIYSSIGYTDNLAVEDLEQKRGTDILREVEPGDDISVGLGAAYALSYKASVHMGIDFKSTRQTEYTWETAAIQKGPDEVAGIFNIGCGLKYSKRQMLIITTGIGLTDDSPDFTFSVRLPFNIN